MRPRGGRFSGNRLSVVIAAYLREHGIDATAHQLLHWFATQVYASSKDIRVTQELLVTRTRPRQRDTWRTAMWTLLLRSRHSSLASGSGRSLPPAVRSTSSSR